jgi:hypothetical protein
MNLKNWPVLALFALLLGGCGVLPLAPGRSSFNSGTTTGQLQQSQNPKSESKQVFTRTVKAGEVSETVETTIGAAQKDVAREMAAKLGSLKGIVWIGVLVFLFGAASAVYPPLKLLVGGSVTTSAVIAVAGLSLIVLPTLIVGNEILILCVALGGAALYFFAHRHASVHSELKTIKAIAPVVPIEPVK